MPTAKTEGARDAERIVDVMWRAAGRDLPVSPFVIADSFGIDVVEADLPPEVSAMLVKERGQDPRIVLNAGDHPRRKRFSCAHELGHFMRRRTDPDVYEYVDSRDIFSSPGDTPDEVYANEFAGCLLMPESDVRLLRREGWTDIELPILLAVSPDAVHHRLKNLRLA